MPEAHTGKLGQGARMRDECLDLWLDILLETASP
jgi:hypothetical protein